MYVSCHLLKNRKQTNKRNKTEKKKKGKKMPVEKN